MGLAESPYGKRSAKRSRGSPRVRFEDNLSEKFKDKELVSDEEEESRAPIRHNPIDAHDLT